MPDVGCHLDKKARSLRKWKEPRSETASGIREAEGIETIGKPH